MNNILLEMIKIGWKTCETSDVRQPVAAVAAIRSKGGKFLYLSAPNYKVQIKLSETRWTIHAEQHLIVKAAKRNLNLDGSWIVVVRKRWDRSQSEYSFGTSKPCAICSSLLQKVGIKKLTYFDENWITLSGRKIYE